MGIIYQLFCPECNYIKEFHLGSGLGSINLQRNLRLFSEDEQREIRALKEQNQIEIFQVENKLAWCEHCEELSEKALLDVEGKEKKRYTFGKHCNTCGEELILYNSNDTEAVKCPVCKGSTLQVLEIGHWD